MEVDVGKQEIKEISENGEVHNTWTFNEYVKVNLKDIEDNYNW
jgi:hypothetical protein